MYFKISENLSAIHRHKNTSKHFKDKINQNSRRKKNEVKLIR